MNLHQELSKYLHSKDLHEAWKYTPSYEWALYLLGFKDKTSRKEQKRLIRQILNK